MSKQKIIVAIISMLLASYLAIPKEILSPTLNAIYCKLNASDCEAEQEK